MNNNGYIFPDTSFDLDDIIKQARMAHTALFTPYAIIVPPFVKRQLIEAPAEKRDGLRSQ